MVGLLPIGIGDILDPSAAGRDRALMESNNVELIFLQEAHHLGG